MVRLGIAVVIVVLCLVALPLGAQTPPGELRLNDSHRRLVIRVEPSASGFILWDGDGTPLGDIAVQADRLQLRDTGGAVHWTVRRKDFGPQIESATGERFYRLRKRTDEWRLEDATKTVVARIRVSGADAEIRDPRGAVMVTVKRDDTGYRFATEAGNRVADLVGANRVAAALWFGVERFSTAERAALWAYFTRLER